jgi:aspartate carbamoyltransferase catalytic subunit
VDVLYMTRIQKERFTDMDEYAKARGEPDSARPAVCFGRMRHPGGGPQ